MKKHNTSNFTQSRRLTLTRLILGMLPLQTKAQQNKNTHHAYTEDYLIKTLEDAIKNQKDSVTIEKSIIIKNKISIDFRQRKISIKFLSPVFSDSTCLSFSHMGDNSEITNLQLINITSPYCINRWKNNSDWNDNKDEIAKTISNTNQYGYQPSPNDKDLWDLLPQNIKEQNISPRLEILNSNSIKIINFSGKFALIELINCNKCSIINPMIEIGGKGALGTIVFNNIGTKEYGQENKVVGGYSNYGTFSAVCFIRNKNAQVLNFSAYRCGESGIKTYQGNLGPRSARCYQIQIESVKIKQVYYDGLDLCSDYGKITERVDDYSISEFPWHQLPTKHQIQNIECEDCNGVGIWGDGTGNIYKNITIRNCFTSNIKLLTTDSYIENIMSLKRTRKTPDLNEYDIDIPFRNAIHNIQTDESTSRIKIYNRSK